MSSAVPDDDDVTTQVRTPALVRPRRVSPCLVVLSGSSVGRVVTFDDRVLSLGRSASSGVRLEDEGISRRHATITRDGTTFVFEDATSRNGSFINGRRVKRQILSGGDHIQLGAVTVLKFGIQDELENQVQQHLYEASVRDLMTQAFNRRHFEEELSRATSHAMRHDEPLSLLALDIDHFKAINDRFGHGAGDRVLKEVALRCSRTLRKEDVFCRVGGEEFAVIARSTPWQNALILAQRLRRAVCETPAVLDDDVLSLGISVGVSGLDALPEPSASALLTDADKYLYEAKRAGRNTVRGPTR
jgi:two-component system, cell cycle response regulator